MTEVGIVDEAKGSRGAIERGRKWAGGWPVCHSQRCWDRYAGRRVLLQGGLAEGHVAAAEATELGSEGRTERVWAKSPILACASSGEPIPLLVTQRSLD